MYFDGPYWLSWFKLLLYCFIVGMKQVMVPSELGGIIQKIWDSLVKCLSGMQETLVRSPGWKIPWRRKWQPTPVFLPGESHGQRSLVGYNPWNCKGCTHLATKPPPCDTVRPCCLSHPVYNALHLLMSNSQSISLLPLGNHKSVIYVCESLL